MNVLLINPTRTGKDSYVSPPLHLLYIAMAVEKAGHQASIIDVHYQFVRNMERISKDDFENRMIEEIISRDFDVLGIGSIVSAFDFSKRLVNALKNRKPHIPVIVGGGLSMSVKDLWLTKTGVDFLCESDGEVVIQKFLQAYPDRDALMKIPGLHVRLDGCFVCQKPDLPKDLDYIDYPSWEKLENLSDYLNIQKLWMNRTLPPHLRLSENDRVMPIVMTRGCPYRCNFCYHVNHLHRRHSVRYLSRYIKYLKEKYGVTYISTFDDLIMADTRWLSDLCDEFIAQKVGVKIFTSGGKPNLVSRGILKKMKEAGFVRMSYGIESGSQKMLDIMKKETTVAQNFNAVEMSIEEGLFVHLNMIVGMPGETLATLNEDSDFLVSLAKKGLITAQNVSFSVAAGYPGTELYDYMLQHKIVTDTEDYLKKQMGVVEYRYNLCGINKFFLQFMVTLILLRVDFYYFCSRHQYLKAAKLIFIGGWIIFKRLMVLALPSSTKRILRRAFKGESLCPV